MEQTTEKCGKFIITLSQYANIDFFVFYFPSTALQTCANPHPAIG